MTLSTRPLEQGHCLLPSAPGEGAASTSRRGRPTGRRLAWATWGAAGGRPVLWMHGWPGSRFAGALLAAGARDAGVRLIIPDRPGIGDSDPLPGRTLLGWADDLAALADHLELHRFDLVGYSGGGPFALAAAHALRHRLRVRADGHAALAVVSSQVPLADPDHRAQMPAPIQAMLALHRQVPFATQLSVGMMALGLRLAPQLLLTQARATLPRPDRHLLDRPEVERALAREYREALRSGTTGVVQEVGLYAEPWGFDLATLPRGCQLYHGEKDRNVPISLARQLAAALPAPQPRWISGAGHLWVVDHAAALLDRLR